MMALHRNAASALAALVVSPNLLKCEGRPGCLLDGGATRAQSSATEVQVSVSFICLQFYLNVKL